MEPVYCTFYLEEVPLSQLLESESEVAQLCWTLCDPMDCSLPGSFIHGISRQEYWSGLPFPSLGDLPNPGIKLRSPTLQPDTLHLSHQGSPFIIIGMSPPTDDLPCYEHNICNTLKFPCFSLF